MGMGDPPLPVMAGPVPATHASTPGSVVPRTPVTVVTGPDAANWIRDAVERGEWKQAVVLKGHVGMPILGCACCVVQGDLHRALRALLPRARRGEIDRVVIETEGPAEASVALMNDPVLASVYRVEDVVSVEEGVRVRRRSRLVAN